MSKFNFMTPVSTAASGFSFGAKPAAPTFGLGASPSGGGMTFGNPPSSAPAFGTPGTAAPSYAASLGAATSATSQFGAGFGTPATAAPAFGTSFGTPATSAPAFGAQTGFGFGATTSAAPAAGLSFGNTMATTGGLNFGAPAAAPAVSLGGMGGFSFGGGLAPATSAAPNFSFGGGLTSTANPQICFPSLVGGLGSGLGGGLGGLGGNLGGGLGGGLNFDPFNYSLPTSTKPHILLYDSFQRQPFNYSPSFIPHQGPSNILHVKYPTEHKYGFLSPSGKPTATQPDASKPAVTVSLGLGGADAGLGLAAASGTGATGQPVSVRTAALPAELMATVEAFKASVRQRKQISSDIARHSIRPLHKVSSDVEALIHEASELNAKLVDKRRVAAGLRARAAEALPAAERAHRTLEAPHGVEYESEEAMAWILDVVGEGESRLRLLRRQLEAAQSQLGQPPRSVTDQELALGMRRIHESFVAVAGRLQAVHQLVEAQKAQYLSLRRNMLKDPTDVFAEKGTPSGPPLSLDWLTRGSDGPIPSAVISDPLAALGVSRAKANPLGPTPFSVLGAPGFGGLSFPNKAPTSAASTLGNTSTWSFTSGGSALGQSGLGQTTLGQAAQGQANLSWLGGAPEQGPFSLQKPPAGNKRGKH